MEKVSFLGDIYDYQENLDGSKLLSIDKNKRGIKMTIKFSGDSEDHKRSHEALKNFFVKSSP
ncbi:hypothetical protein HF638_12560 [Paenibacillus sp. SZ31]|uniref:hypothetical protein n=1 Tax=Paenibacillus TaxID=44249 RepID=UPI00146E9FFE|nr:hypothetical protein [Paenibacillus sp. SZ31]NMI04815.1 hypothetical protein [Paenibacillus sp. SZ31]